MGISPFTADNGVANSKYFGDVGAITFEVSDEGNIYKNRFVVTDTDATRQVKLGGVGATVFDVRGVVSTRANISNGHAGTTALPYTENDIIRIDTRGFVKVEAVADSGIVYGDKIIVGADGKAAKFVAPTVIGDTSAGDVSDAIEAYVDAFNTIVGVAMGAPDSDLMVTVELREV